MADRYELAFVKNALSATGTNPQEQGSLESELFKRLLAAGLTVSAAGVIGTTVPLANGLVYRVEDYGAVGNGVTDDSTAIALAISTAVAAGGGTVYLGPKTYNIGSTTLVVTNTVNLIGMGYASTLSYTGTGSAVRLSASQFATVGHFVVLTTNDAGTAIEAGTATRQSMLTHIYAVGPTTLTNTGAGFYLNAIAGFSGGLTIYNCNCTGYKFGVKFVSVNTSTDTWTAVDITSLWAVGRAAGVVANSCGISFDANTNAVGTKWRGGTIEAFATGIKHVAGGFGGDIACDLEGNTADISVGSGFTGQIINAQTGAVTYGDASSVLVQEAAGTMALRNSTTSQTELVYNTYTNAANYQRLGLYGNYSNGPGIAVEQAGTGLTTNRNLNLISAASGGIAFWPNSAALFQIISSAFKPFTDLVGDLGDATHRINTAYIGGAAQVPKATGLVFVGTSFNLSITAVEPAAARTLTLPLIRQAETVAIKPQTYTTLSTPLNPVGTSNTSGLMMGLAGAITPQVTGNVRVTICGQLSNTATNGAKVQIRVGTGSAPTNGGALAGTVYGSQQSITAIVGALSVPFCLSALVTGLTLGTACWLDVDVAAIVGGTATIASVAIDAFEL